MNKLYYGMVVSRIKKALEDSKVASEYDNQVLKGRAREIFVSDMLIPFLDRSFGVCTGIVIDSEGRHSNQLDIIIYNTAIVPPVMLTEGEGIIPYEAVLATIEVKTRLNSAELGKSVQNARSLKVLTFRPQEILRPLCRACLDRIGSPPDKQSPVCFIFAFNSDLAAKGDEAERLNQCVARLNEECETKVDLPISALCVANKGFSYCTDMKSIPPKFKTIQKNEEANVLEFVLNVVNSCNVRAAEREKLYLGMYLK
jgi:hypothetical protein